MMKEKVAAVAGKYLAMKDYEVLENDFEDFMFAIDDEDVLHIINVQVTSSEDEFEDVHATRKEFEKAMIKFFDKHNSISDLEIVFDTIDMYINKDETGAILRHHIKCMY